MLWRRPAVFLRGLHLARAMIGCDDAVIGWFWVVRLCMFCFRQQHSLCRTWMRAGGIPLNFVDYFLGAADLISSAERRLTAMLLRVCRFVVGQIFCAAADTLSIGVHTNNICILYIHKQNPNTFANIRRKNHNTTFCFGCVAPRGV